MMVGRRISGVTEAHLLQPGDYGQTNAGVWIAATPPNAKGESFDGDLRQHDVVEHEDGTITVSPSILCSGGDRGDWHGYLARGVWREC